MLGNNLKSMNSELINLRKQASSLTQELLTSVAESPDEDYIKLIKAPGKKGADSLNVSVDIFSEPAILPYYVSKIIECAADHAEVSYEEMLNIVHTFHKIIDGTRDVEKRVRHEPVQ